MKKADNKILIAKAVFKHLRDDSDDFRTSAVIEALSKEKGCSEDSAKQLIYRHCKQVKAGKGKSQWSITDVILGEAVVYLSDRAVKTFRKIFREKHATPLERLRDSIVYLLGWKSDMTRYKGSLWAQEINRKNFGCFVRAKFRASMKIISRVGTFFKKNKALVTDEKYREFTQPCKNEVSLAKLIVFFLINSGETQMAVLKQKKCTIEVKKSFIKSVFRYVEFTAGLRDGCLKIRNKPRAKEIDATIPYLEA